MDRRAFVSSAALTAASYNRVMGANGRLRAGTIGSGPRGQYLTKTLKSVADVQFVGVSDVYDVRRRQGAEIMGGKVAQYNDYHQLLDRKDLDIVIVATPDHWHCQVAIDACLAGKDAYVEKPMSARPEQGVKLVKVARDTRRIVSVGTQQRTGAHYLEAKAKVIDSGILGKIGMVRTWYNANNGYVMTAPGGFETKPEGLDWDRWLGYLPKEPWNPEKFFSPFKWMNIGGGMVAGIFIHCIDTVHHFLKLKGPSAAVAGGGIYHFKDGRDTPDCVNVILEYPQEVNVTFEGECLTCREKYNAVAGMEFHGTGGVLTVLRYNKELGWEFVPNPKNCKLDPMRGPGIPAWADPNLKHWTQCVRDRKQPVANAETGHYSAMACHMGNMAWRSKSRVIWDKKWDV
ncbi:MAG: Gfo/Idh/MocA family oxidoreductase [Acidobacteria bacterium]|nr:Gfo/Idh/MocA family oxidoreductase [Acidobacteriota bacterium]